MGYKVKICNEYKLLLLAMKNKSDSGTIKKIHEITNEDLDWDFLIQIAIKHKSRAILYSQLNKIPNLDIPGRIMSDLENYFFFNTRKNLLMFRELLSILKAFKSSGIDVIPYKGPLLTTMAYENISLREFADLDIYVNLKDIHKVEEIMSSLRYEPLFELSKSQKQVYFQFQREFKFINNINNVLVETKWKYIVPSFSFDINPDTLFNSNTKLIRIFNSHINTICPENLLILLSIHNAGHYWPYLSWIGDIFHLLNSQKNLNWSLIIHNAEILGSKRVVYINLYLVFILFDMELPKCIIDQFDQDELIKKIALRIVNFLIIDEKKPNWNDKLFIRFNIREKKKNKILDSLKAVFMPTIPVISSVRLSNKFYSFYYVLRIFQLFKIYLFKKA